MEESEVGTAEPCPAGNSEARTAGNSDIGTPEAAEARPIEEKSGVVSAGEASVAGSLQQVEIGPVENDEGQAARRKNARRSEAWHKTLGAEAGIAEPAEGRVAVAAKALVTGTGHPSLNSPRRISGAGRCWRRQRRIPVRLLAVGERTVWAGPA